MTIEADYVTLGLTCAEICTALEQGLDGKEWAELSLSVRKAIEKLKG